MKKQVMSFLALFGLVFVLSIYYVLLPTNLFVGVNGVGKTTTIGKLAHKYISEGKKVMLIAGDTFRAGAIEQLATWAKKIGVDIVYKDAGSDPSSVMFDAVNKAKNEGYDVYAPIMKYCTDNAAMIGVAGSVAYRYGVRGEYDLSAKPGFDLESSTR